jgi:hypothetical protein
MGYFFIVLGLPTRPTYSAGIKSMELELDA